MKLEDAKKVMKHFMTKSAKNNSDNKSEKVLDEVLDIIFDAVEKAGNTEVNVTLRSSEKIKLK